MSKTVPADPTHPHRHTARDLPAPVPGKWVRVPLDLWGEYKRLNGLDVVKIEMGSGPELEITVASGLAKPAGEEE